MLSEVVVEKIPFSVLRERIKDDWWNNFNGSIILKRLAKLNLYWAEIGVDSNHMDTIFIYPRKNKPDYTVLEMLGWAMGADEVDYYKDQNGETVLRCWWD